MRMSIASPGNDFRLGACEAPPAIVSTYLGDDMTNYLEAFVKSKSIKGESSSFCVPACSQMLSTRSALLLFPTFSNTPRILSGCHPSEYVPHTKEINLGVDSIAPFTVPAEDRNRTSPFPYGGHRFEFRAVGSSQVQTPRLPSEECGVALLS